MWLFIQLFVTFFIVGIVSFGGGYAMIPVMEHEVVVRYGWMTIEQFRDAMAIAGMSPGPIAVNSAVFIGYETAGIAGAIASVIGVVLPSLIITILVAMFFYKVYKTRSVKAAFYGLRPVVTGLIIYAALIFAQKSGMIASISMEMVSSIIIFLTCLILLMRFRIHPVLIIVLSGMAGILIYA